MIQQVKLGWAWHAKRAGLSPNLILWLYKAVIHSTISLER